MMTKQLGPRFDALSTRGLQVRLRHSFMPWSKNCASPQSPKNSVVVEAANHDGVRPATFGVARLPLLPG